MKKVIYYKAVTGTVGCAHSDELIESRVLSASTVRRMVPTTERWTGLDKLLGRKLKNYLQSKEATEYSISVA